MQPSPYTPGEVARSVPGRLIQLGEFDERLSYLVDLHHLVGRIRVDHAPRGFGKTSLLREYQRRAQARDVLTVWVTAGDRAGLIAQLASEISLATANWRDEARNAISSRLESLTLRLGVPNVVGLDATLRPASRPIPSGYRELEAVVRAAAVTEERNGLLILIDEVQAADAAGLLTLAYAWQHLQSEGSEIPAAVFAAGLPGASEVISQAVTFSERFAYRPLLPLEREAEELALVMPAKELGVEWNPAALDDALAIARGYPYVLQLIGDAAWTAAGRPDPGSQISPGHVSAGHQAMETDLDALFRARWSNASPGERDLLRAMASLGEETLRRADIARVLHVTSESLSVPRARLIDKGFIQPGTRGTLEFTIPGFAAFIRNLDR